MRLDFSSFFSGVNIVSGGKVLSRVSPRSKKVKRMTNLVDLEKREELVLSVNVGGESFVVVPPEIMGEFIVWGNFTKGILGGRVLWEEDNGGSLEVNEVAREGIVKYSKKFSFFRLRSIDLGKLFSWEGLSECGCQRTTLLVKEETAKRNGSLRLISQYPILPSSMF